MPSELRRKTKIFEIAYKCFRHELSDWSHEYVRAADRKNALRIFASRHHIKTHKGDQPTYWYWWDGDWYMSFRLIREIERLPQKCPHCRGTGMILESGV